MDRRGKFGHWSNQGMNSVKRFLKLELTALVFGGMFSLWNVWHKDASTLLAKVPPPSDAQRPGTNPVNPVTLEPEVSLATTGLEKEVPGGDPYVRHFIDTKGITVRILRTTPEGWPVSDTHIKNGHTDRVEKTFEADGTLIKLKRYQNDLLVEEKVFR